MQTQVELTLLPHEAFNNDTVKSLVSQKLNLDPSIINAIKPIRRSIDARPTDVVYTIMYNVYITEEPQPLSASFYKYEPVKGDKKVIIVGNGPAGIFAAFRLIELGIKPIIIERGKDVITRRRDIRAIQQDHFVNPDSNYCFGEGGAGTYSDGKLYTRATKRGDLRKVLTLFVQHGAPEDVLIDTHPHIGSNKLPQIISNMNKTIINCGGEVHFNSKVTDFIIKDNICKGVIVNNNNEFTADAVILAAGHSARDIYYLLHTKKIFMEPKPFAMGVRIEHPQALINEIQYHTKEKNPFLPSASYNVSAQINRRGVFSFCMCPGGIIVPAATEPGELVVNGMSLSRRNSPFANAGFVVAIEVEDMAKYEKYGPFAGLKFQQELEKMAFEAGGKTQTAPAQRVTDFIANKLSESLPKCSYIPGVRPAPLHLLLPSHISQRMKFGLQEIDANFKGYITSEAQILGVESRTSSPVRITRNKYTYQHVQIEKLFPAGEGAGYAGGIVSASMDGENVANAVAYSLK